MPENGQTTLDLTLAATLDEVIGNRDGSTVRVAANDFAAQVASMEPIAELPGRTSALETGVANADTKNDAQDGRLDLIEATQTSGMLSRATWADLSADVGVTDGAGGEVLDSDVGDHLAATATGYDGASVPNAGRYSWNGTWERWVRIGGTGLSAKADKTELPKILAASNDLEAMRVLNGRGTNYGDASRMLEGYIRTDTGAFVANASYESCDFVAIDPEITLEVQFSQGLAATATANLIFYADDKTTILGIYNVAGAATEYIRPSSLYPTARYVIGTDYNHLIPPNGFTLRVHSRVEPGKVLGSEVDFFREQTYPTYYDIPNGAYRISVGWVMTGLIPVYQGQAFVLTATTSGSGAFPTLIGLDRDGLYVAALRTTSATRATVTISNPAVAYIRAASFTSGSPSIVGGRVRHIPHPKALIPAEIVGVVGEGLGVYARSIVPDRNFPVGWSAEQSTERAFIATGAAAGVERHNIASVVDGGRARLDFGEIAFRYTTVPGEPASHINMICNGDSTAEGTGALDGGTFRDWPNEMSRQMTGVGTPAIPDNTYYTPWGLTKVHFRGTMGLNTVKHEGRGGWSAEDYLTLADKTGRANAFWNPGTSDFDIDYYLTNNGFDIGSDPTGVDATGSNLIYILQLGWNDIRNKGAVAAAADCATMIDKIKAKRPDTKFLILGLPPTPRQVRRNVLPDGGRIILPELIMTEYILPHRREYSAIAAARTDVHYLDLAPTFDAETGFRMTAPQPVVPFSSDVSYTAPLDYVHAGPWGNMMTAATIKAFIRYKFLP